MYLFSFNKPAPLVLSTIFLWFCSHSRLLCSIAFVHRVLLYTHSQRRLFLFLSSSENFSQLTAVVVVVARCKALVDSTESYERLSVALSVTIGHRFTQLCVCEPIKRECSSFNFKRFYFFLFNINFTIVLRL